MVSILLLVGHLLYFCESRAHIKKPVFGKQNIAFGTSVVTPHLDRALSKSVMDWPYAKQLTRG